MRESDLAALQKRRELPVRVVQAFQGLMQKNLAAPALHKGKAFRLPWLLRVALKLPLVRDWPARLIAFGVRRVRVHEAPRP